MYDSAVVASELREPSKKLQGYQRLSVDLGWPWMQSSVWSSWSGSALSQTLPLSLETFSPSLYFHLETLPFGSEALSTLSVLVLSKAQLA